jgi:very-short-patch-repair endonuclease
MREVIRLAPGLRVRAIAVRVRKIAEAQEGVIGRAQLEECGLSGGEISRWVAQARLIRVLPAVYALGHTRLSWRGRLFAALLYAGRESALSHETAAYLWKLVEHRGDRVHVSCAGSRRSAGFVVMHRPRVVDSTEREGLKLTTASRTLVDISPGCPDYDLRKSLSRADFHGLLDPDSLNAQMGKGVDGSGVLRQAIEKHMPELARTLSPLEDKLLLLCEQRRLPLPEPNVRIEGHLVDALWREARLIVEVDGRANHSSPSQRRSDSERDEELRAGGYEVLRYRWHDITHEPSRVAREIRATLDASTPSA